MYISTADTSVPHSTNSLMKHTPLIASENMLTGNSNGLQLHSSSSPGKYYLSLFKNRQHSSISNSSNISIAGYRLVMKFIATIHYEIINFHTAAQFIRRMHIASNTHIPMAMHNKLAFLPFICTTSIKKSILHNCSTPSFPRVSSNVSTNLAYRINCHATALSSVNHSNK